ncbi:KilA-N domain-containing protein [Microvirgula curvata]
MMQIIKAESDGHTMQFREDGWFNAMVAAERFGKRVDHWLANRETDQYITALSELLNTRNSGELIHARKGRNGGTWLHPKLAVAFARWLDVRFAVCCPMPPSNRQTAARSSNSSRSASSSVARVTDSFVIACSLAYDSFSLYTHKTWWNRWNGGTNPANPPPWPI